MLKGKLRITTNMKKIIIYSTRICPYCVRAKNFFSKKNIEYTEIMIDRDPEQMRVMTVSYTHLRAHET